MSDKTALLRRIPTDLEYREKELYPANNQNQIKYGHTVKFCIIDCSAKLSFINFYFCRYLFYYSEQILAMYDSNVTTIEP